MNTKTKMQKSDDEWKKELTPEQYRVLREKGTERPFSGAYLATTDKGMYLCAACGNELFASEHKYDAGCGWPSYDQTISESAVTTQTDASLGMSRTEVTCSRCGGHLGHVFDDGPRETTGKRYCINSASLTFEKRNEK